MSQNYDIFISYRREAFESASLICEKLKAAGYKVFLDLEAMRSGKFNEQLYQVIEQCKDFVLVLPENALDRCSDPKDWVRLEITHAIKHQKNIVPVLLRNFTWPKPMPEGLEGLDLYQGVSASSHEYFDMAVQRMATYLKSRPQRKWKRWVAAAASLVLILALFFLIFRIIAIPSATHVANQLTQQAGIVSVLGDVNHDLQKHWSDFYTEYRYEPTERRKEMLVQDIRKSLPHQTAELEGYRKRLQNDYQLQLGEGQQLHLALYDIDPAEVMEGQVFAISLIDEIEQQAAFIREAVEDGEVSQSENESIQLGFTAFSHYTNIYYYGLLDILSRMPRKSLENYRTLSTTWRNFPNGIGLNHSSDDYNQYVEQEVNILESMNFEAKNRLIHLRDDADKELSNLRSVIDQYDQLYQDVAAQSHPDSTLTIEQNWLKIAMLASFLPDAAEMENDDEMELPSAVTAKRVLGDLDTLLDEYSGMYPWAIEACHSAKEFYRSLANGRKEYGGQIVLISNSSKLKNGDIVTAVDGKSLTGLSFEKQANLLLSDGEKTLTILASDKRTVRYNPSSDQVGMLPLVSREE